MTKPEPSRTLITMFMDEMNVMAPFENLFTPSSDPSRSPASGILTVRLIDRNRHDAFAETHSAGYTQTPDWAAVKPDWLAENLGWFDGEQLVGTALVLYRPVPGTARSLAYLPEGPLLPWSAVSARPDRWLDPMVQHLRARQAFAVRIGPEQVIRVWTAATAKRGLADPELERFDELPADEVFADGKALEAALGSAGWTALDRGPGFGSGQPRFGVRLPLAGRTVAQLRAGTNQQWRRNVTRAAKAGVVVREGSIDDLTEFHRLYVETGERDGFRPRPLSYFIGMWKALSVTTGEPRIRIYLAELGKERRALAAALVIQVGTSCWYSYGGSSSENRQAQASTALQWHSICAAQARGCDSYDLRGITDTLDPGQPTAGLLRFKLGTGGNCVETVGEWELVLAPLWHKAFELYRRVRS